MLSYRHGYHAGNFADVMKHLILISILEYLKKKATPFYYHDTHAGAGIYGIKHRYMQKNREYMAGIGRLWGVEVKTPLLKDYLAIIRQLNPTSELEFYPGSPEIAVRLMRKTDRAWLGEMHPTEFEILSEHFHDQHRVKCEKLDAWQGLKAKLPPLERRGLICIDPSYEIDSDYKQVYKGILEALHRFANGVYAIWYPVADIKKTEKMLKQFAGSGIPGILDVQLGISKPDPGPGMHASGMLIINPPYTLAETMQQTLPELVSILCGDDLIGNYHVETLI